MPIHSAVGLLDACLHDDDTMVCKYGSGYSRASFILFRSLVGPSSPLTTGRPLKVTAYDEEEEEGELELELSMYMISCHHGNPQTGTIKGWGTENVSSLASHVEVTTKHTRFGGIQHPIVTL